MDGESRKLSLSRLSDYIFTTVETFSNGEREEKLVSNVFLSNDLSANVSRETTTTRG